MLMKIPEEPQGEQVDEVWMTLWKDAKYPAETLQASKYLDFAEPKI